MVDFARLWGGRAYMEVVKMVWLLQIAAHCVVLKIVFGACAFVQHVVLGSPGDHHLRMA
jgi:hypothetical protein